MKKKKRSFRLLIIVVLAVIILLVVGKKAGWFGKEFATRVAVEKAEKKDITEIITANGKIEPQTEVKISPEVPGEIIELPVKEGDEVKEGDLLAIIKPDIYISNLNRLRASLNTQKARLAQSEAQLTEKKLNFDRSQQLYKQQTISQSDFQSAEAAYKVAVSEVEAARYMVKSAESSVQESQENLTKTKIYAPITGTISKLNVEKGERVVGTNQFAGTELMTVANLNSMEVKVEVNENDIVKVQLGDTALVEIDAYVNRKFKGIVTEIASSANVTGTSTDQVTNFDVKILLLQSSYNDLLKKPSDRYPFLPGMSATVDIRTNTRNGVITVPIQAVTTRSEKGEAKNETTGLQRENSDGTDEATNGKPKPEAKQHEVVFVYNDGVVREKQVKTGIQDNVNIQIEDGLKDGEEVVVAPYGLISRTLKDSMTVEVVPIDDLYKTKK
ncbi:RND transporter [Prolixibacter bellariivorans]|uniref:RND transporter n=1 Tax=Prolixibacter bellariivorans TaxID=314319 RepID=A0A5M4AXQ7_9BACT|nr:efflux RND transporter periplasmic adaptor subunit [Prolixibacter bellariivorans]GET32534.1 RND transporter [Prolixibacter bellariivorans]